MQISAPLVLAVSLALASSSSAQSLSTYRGYALDSTVEAIVAQTSSHAAAVRTLQDGPVRIQQLESFSAGTADASRPDALRGIVFRFVDDRLYEMVATFDTSRTAGLTVDAAAAQFTDAYGPPAAAKSRTAPVGRVSGISPDAVVKATWSDATTSLTLYRNLYAAEYQVLVRSIAGATAARAAQVTTAEARGGHLVGTRPDVLLHARDAVTATDRQ